MTTGWVSRGVQDISHLSRGKATDRSKYEQLSESQRGYLQAYPTRIQKNDIKKCETIKRR